jgi:hydrogenase maturation protease
MRVRSAGSALPTAPHEPATPNSIVARRRNRTMPAMESALLVIGYGNTLRQDDGAGPHVAERIEALGLPGVATLVCAQLSPEHVETVARAATVVFVDASVEASREVQLRPVGAASSSHIMAHALEPPTILALARDVYGRAPQAWLLTIPAVRLGFGEDLSPEALGGIETAVQAFLDAFGPKPSPDVAA